MKLQSIKTDSQLVLKGITFDMAWTDNSITQVQATDEDGNLVVFKIESYSFKAMIKAPPKMVKKYLLSGAVAGVPVESIYDEKHEAENAKNDHERMVSSDEYCTLQISQIEVAEAA